MLKKEFVITTYFRSGNPLLRWAWKWTFWLYC